MFIGTTPIFPTLPCIPTYPNPFMLYMLVLYINGTQWVSRLMCIGSSPIPPPNLFFYVVQFTLSPDNPSFYLFIYMRANVALLRPRGSSIPYDTGISLSE